jgi:hypothetical protein
VHVVLRRVGVVIVDDKLDVVHICGLFAFYERNSRVRIDKATAKLLMLQMNDRTPCIIKMVNTQEGMHVHVQYTLHGTT